MPVLDSLRPHLKRRALNVPSPKKRVKIHHPQLDDLPWKSVQTTGFDGDDGILELEELDGVQLTYEDTDAGRTVKFNVIQLFVVFLSVFF
jgi:ATP-dependent RNA helicase DDX24/MAK5